jgi:hypothetical protein
VNLPPIDLRLHHRRVAIGGGPRTGKSTLSLSVARELEIDPLAIQHTDELMGVLEWSQASAQVAEWMAEPGPWCIEGMAVPRALRKALAARPEAKPCDMLIWRTAPFGDLLPGHLSMAKGAATILGGIDRALVALGVEIRRM